MKKGGGGWVGGDLVVHVRKEKIRALHCQGGP